MCSHDSLGSNNNRDQLGSSHARGPVGGWPPPEGQWRAAGGCGGEGGQGRGLFLSWGRVICYTPLSHHTPPKSPGPLRCSPNDTPDLPTSLHPAAPTPGPGCHGLSPGPLPGFLTGSLLATWAPTFRSPHTARRIFPKCKSYHITLLLKPAKGCLSHLEENPKPSL